MVILIVFILALPIKPGLVRLTSISRTSILCKEAEEFLLLRTDLEDLCRSKGVLSSRNCGRDCIKLLLLGPTTFGGGGAMVISSEIRLTQ